MGRERRGLAREAAGRGLSSLLALEAASVLLWVFAAAGRGVSRAERTDGGRDEAARGNSVFSTARWMRPGGRSCASRGSYTLSNYRSSPASDESGARRELVRLIASTGRCQRSLVRTSSFRLASTCNPAMGLSIDAQAAYTTGLAPGHRLFLLVCVQGPLEQFRLPELHSVAQLYSIPLSWPAPPDSTVRPVSLPLLRPRPPPPRPPR